MAAPIIRRPTILPPPGIKTPPAPAPYVSHVKQGLTRVEFDAADLPAIVHQAGGAIYFPRDNDASVGDVLQLWVGGRPTTDPPFEMNRGGVYRVPFAAESVKVNRVLPDITSDAIASSPLVIYIADDPQWDFSAGIDTLITFPGTQASAFLGGVDFGLEVDPGNIFDLSGARPNSETGELFTAVPGADTVNCAWSLAGIRTITLMVYDMNGSASSPVGTVIRPWWYYPTFRNGAGSSVTPKVAGIAGAGTGWIPDPQTFTIDDERNRTFIMPINVTPGYTPAFATGIAGASRNPTSNITTWPAQFTFEVTGLPAGAAPGLVMVAQIDPVL